LGDHFWYRYAGDLAEIAIRPFRPDALVSLSAVLIPLMLLPPFRGWRSSWPGLLLLVSYIFASWLPQASLYYQYFAQTVPFLIAGAIPFVANGSAQRLRLSALATVAIFALLGPLIYIGYGLPDRFAAVVLGRDERAMARPMIQALASDETISATELIVPAVAWRADVHPFPGPMVCGNSVGYHTPSTRAADYVLFEPTDAPQGPDWNALLTSWGYELVEESQGIELWEHSSGTFDEKECPSWEEQKRAANV
jgi:hypothetical protein